MRGKYIESVTAFLDPLIAKVRLLRLISIYASENDEVMSIQHMSHHGGQRAKWPFLKILR